jgi:hypothetical protein
MSIFDVLKAIEDKLSFKKRAIVGGIIFDLALLNYEQDQMINSIPEEGDTPLSFYDKTRAQVLSHAIIGINGEVIPDIVQVPDGDRTITKERPIYVREFLKKIPPKLIDKLFEIYVDFKEEMDNRLEEEVQYEWYKTPDVRKKEREENEIKERAEALSENKDPEQDNTGTSEEAPITFTKLSDNDDETTQVG